MSTRDDTHSWFWWKGNFHVFLWTYAVTSLCSPGNSHFLLHLALGRAHGCWEWACDSCNDGKIPWLWVALSKDNTHENDTPYHTNSVLFRPSPILCLFYSRLLIFGLIPDDLRLKKKQWARENKTDRQTNYILNHPHTLIHCSLH